MEIKLNGEILKLPCEGMSVAEFINWRGVTGAGVAIAVNNRIVSRPKWTEAILKQDDEVVLISAAYGG